jgi:hypothetical protein
MPLAQIVGFGFGTQVHRPSVCQDGEEEGDGGEEEPLDS